MDGRGDGKHGGPPGRDMLGPLVGRDAGKVYTVPGAQKEKLRKRAYAHPAPSARRVRPYAELRAASAFSFLNGASLPEDLADTAAALDLPAMALIDTNGLSGAPRFWKAAKQAGIKALVGAEVVLERGPKSTRDFSLRGRGERRGARPGTKSALRAPGDFLRRVKRAMRTTGRCLAKRRIAPSTIRRNPKSAFRSASARPARPRSSPSSSRRLSPAPHASRREPDGLPQPLQAHHRSAAGKPKGEARATWEEIEEHAEGLHLLTGGDESPLAALVDAGDAAARALANGWRTPSPGASTSSSSATAGATRSGATAPWSTSRARPACRSWRPTASASRGPRRSRSSTS